MIAFNQPLKSLADCFDSVPHALLDLHIKGLCFDSRDVNEGDAFFALPSVAGNEQANVAQAVESGACIIIVNEALAASLPSMRTPLIVVADVTDPAGRVLAQCLYKNTLPMNVLGITGTNGKSSISFYLAQLLTALKAPCAVMGTVGFGPWDNLTPSGMTTLPLEKLHHVLSDLSQQYQSVAMEVSSHGLAQNRLAGVQFSGAVFSNLSRDHLDYHGTMQAYGEAKALLFTRPELEFAVINADDEFALSLAQKMRITPVYYGQAAHADLRFEIVSAHAKGIDVEFFWQQQTHRIHLALFGLFNVENTAAAVLVCLQLGHDMDAIMQAMHNITAVPGRMQQINTHDDQPIVLVDYAHTPDALKQVLTATKTHTQGRITLVVGCGGDRDTGKRQLMGEIALKYADNTVITSDNPRSEEPLDICQQMVSGLTGKYDIVVDRAQAIEQAIMQANDNDIVIIAGKGHEDYQEIKGQRHYFSDVKAAEKILQLESQA